MVLVTTAPARRTNAERSAETQARLLDATIECLVERGWSGTSTTEIVRRANVSRGAQVHHYPSKDDLVLAAMEHLLARRIEEFRTAFADLPLDQRSPAAAMRLLYEHCFGSTFEALLELVMAARIEPALHARLVEFQSRFFESALTTFRGLFADAAADDTFARIALRLAFCVLDGLAIGRLTGATESDREAALEAFNAIVSPYFPNQPGGAS
jgi:AcrR family transcriptional regulator